MDAGRDELIDILKELKKLPERICRISTSLRRNIFCYFHNLFLNLKIFLDQISGKVIITLNLMFFQC